MRAPIPQIRFAAGLGPALAFALLALAGFHWFSLPASSAATASESIDPLNTARARISDQDPPHRSTEDGQTFDHTSSDRSTRIWLPDGLETVRGLLIYGNPYGGDSRHYIENQALRGFGRLHGFAVIGTAGFGYLQNDEILIWESHLDSLASLSGHGEIVHAPWAPLGFSNGGQMSYGFNARRPEKVLGFIANKGGYYNDPLPPEPALQTPGILVAGELDTEFRRTVIRSLFQENRARGALWAWVEEQEMGHEGDDERLFLPFLSEVIRLRYPAGQEPTDTSGVTLLTLFEEDGWLSDPATWKEPLAWIAPHDDYPGDPLEACWLPGEKAAFLYRAFATRTDWLDKGGGGIILDRPLYIEEPGWDDYWHEEPGIAPHQFHLRIDTREYPGWIRAEIYSGADLLMVIDGIRGGTDRPGQRLDQRLRVESRGSAGSGLGRFEAAGSGSGRFETAGSGVARIGAAAAPGADSLVVDLILDSGVHGLSALFTDPDGTVRTTGLRHVVVEAPDPSGIEDRLDAEQEGQAEQAGEDGSDLLTLRLLGRHPTPGPVALEYRLEAEAEVDLSVFDPAGRRMGVLCQGLRPAGLHQVAWSTGDCPTGVYFIRLQARAGMGPGAQELPLVRTRRVVLLGP